MKLFQKKPKIESWGQIKVLEAEYISAFEEFVKAEKKFKAIERQITRDFGRQGETVFLTDQIRIVSYPETVFADSEKLKKNWPEIWEKVKKTRKGYIYTTYTGRRIP